MTQIIPTKPLKQMLEELLTNLKQKLLEERASIVRSKYYINDLEVSIEETERNLKQL